MEPDSLIGIADNFLQQEEFFPWCECHVTILSKRQNVPSKIFSIFSPIVNHSLSVFGAI